MLKAARLRPAPQAITVDTTVGACYDTYDI
jgi:hypothetical protein